MDEVANQKVAPTLPHDALEYRQRQKTNITKKPRICAVCDKTFYARRSDALYCSQRCRQKGNYRKVLKQDITPPFRQIMHFERLRINDLQATFNKVCGSDRPLISDT